MPSGPLSGVKVVEFASIGPGPMCGMLLSDMGADIVRIERKGSPPPPASHVYNRGRRVIVLDLKDPRDVETSLRLCDRAELVFEGYRPGVMERLGLGPDVLRARNPRLVYGRMTGWGQDGPNAALAGHDINYIALTGALHAIGSKDQPYPPLSLVGDFGGGSLFLALGLVSALVHARATGEGQVIDAAMCDGANYLMSMTHALHAAGDWRDAREANIADGGAPFYRSYRCADGAFVSIGSMEPQFYATLLERLGLADEPSHDQNESSQWAARSQRFAEIFATRTRDEWVRHFDGHDACFAPVLSLAEVPLHPQNRDRAAFVARDGVLHVSPAPRFQGTPGAIQETSGEPMDIAAVLDSWGIAEAPLDTVG